MVVAINAFADDKEEERAEVKRRVERESEVFAVGLKS